MVQVIKKELKIGTDDAMCASIGAPNKKSKGGKTGEMEKLVEQRKLLMKNLAKRHTDLETFMKAIGALSITKDKRVTVENNFEIESESVENMETELESTEVVESSRNSVGGDALRQLRQNLHFSSTFHSTQVTPVTPPPTTPANSPGPMSSKLTIELGTLHAMNRLHQANMVLSTTQPETIADGNCFIYAILDQLRYDPVWRFLPFSPDTFRSNIVSSLNLMISQGRFESPFTDDQRQNWLLRMGSNYEYCDHYFIQLCANILDRSIEIVRVMSEERITISPVGGMGGHLLHSPLYVMFYEESHFIEPHYQSIRPSTSAPTAPTAPTVPIPYSLFPPQPNPLQLMPWASTAEV